MPARQVVGSSGGSCTERARAVNNGLVIKYIGSKRMLVPAILRCVQATPGARSVIDLFSGTSRVGHALKRAGYRVLSNDHNAYAHTIATCYVQADAQDVLEDARRLLEELSRLPAKEGYFTEIFCRRSRFFHPRNGARVDAVREAIQEMDLHSELRAVLLTSLMLAADRVDATTAVQMAYLKELPARAYNDLDLRLPDVLERAPAGKGEAHAKDALEAARELEADVAYIDPPYNQHSYLRNYHVWESLVVWDKPAVYGVACKRTDCRERVSDFNSRSRCFPTLEAVVRAVRARTLIVSFSNEGFVDRDQMESLLASLPGGREVATIEIDYPRYVGAKIGIYNPKGKKVGRVSHVRNTEHLYVVSEDAERIAGLVRGHAMV